MLSLGKLRPLQRSNGKELQEAWSRMLEHLSGYPRESGVQGKYELSWYRECPRYPEIPVLGDHLPESGDWG
jgi:hypothetical protein